jgi:hypothetical protein
MIQIQKLKREYNNKLAQTDYKILRHLEQTFLNIPATLTNEEIKNLCIERENIRKEYDLDKQAILEGELKNPEEEGISLFEKITRIYSQQTNDDQVFARNKRNAVLLNESITHRVNECGFYYHGKYFSTEASSNIKWIGIDIKKEKITPPLTVYTIISEEGDREELELNSTEEIENFVDHVFYHILLLEGLEGNIRNALLSIETQDELDTFMSTQFPSKEYRKAYIRQNIETIFNYT